MLINLVINYIKKLRKVYYKKNIINRAKSFTEPIKVNGPSYINSNTFLGKNVNFNGMKIIGNGRVSIGDNFHSGINCYIITDVHNYEGSKIPYDNTYIVKEVLIEDNVWLGNGVTVLGGVRIGEGAIIQAGSVVVKDIPELGIAGGHPANVFKYRDKDHYFDLKDKKAFN